MNVVEIDSRLKLLIGRAGKKVQASVDGKKAAAQLYKTL